MIRKSADSLVPWEDGRSYNSLSRVWYQRRPDLAGYAYKYTPSNLDNGNAPDTNPAWSIDYTFAAPWNEYGKYKVGARVWYFNGNKAYAYIASPRYFGGTGKPNEEVDYDGIRTWEIEVDYEPIPYSFLSVEPPPHAQFVYPTRNFGGLADSRLFPWVPTHPEEKEFMYISAAGDGGGGNEEGEVQKFLNTLGGQFDDYSGHNSIYQSYPYDENTYKFNYKELDLDGNKQPMGRGIHIATFTKNHAAPDDKFQQNGDRQFVYVTGQGNYLTVVGWDYYQRWGFAIEMWPSLSESDYELVPTIGLNDHLKPVMSLYHPYDKTPLNPWPEIYTAVKLSDFPTITSGGGGSREIYGDIKDPNGVGVNGIPDEDCKAFAHVQRSTPFFSEREVKLYLLITQSPVTYISNPIYEPIYDENGNQIGSTIVGYDYYPQTQKPSVLLASENTSSFDRNYKETEQNLDSYTRSIINPKLVDLAKYKRNNTYTGIHSVGWRVL